MPPDLPPLPPPDPADRSIAVKRRLFTAAIEAGCTQREASRRAGINESTASRWVKRGREERSDLPSKERIVSDLFSEYLKADTPYKANLAKRIFEAMGFAMRAQADDTNRHPTRELRELVITWWNERPNAHVKSDIAPKAAPTNGSSEVDITSNYRTLAGAEPTRGVDPPAGARAEAFGATPAPPQNSENSAPGERAVTTQGSVVLAATDSAPVK